MLKLNKTKLAIVVSFILFINHTWSWLIPQILTFGHSITGGIIWNFIGGGIASFIFLILTSKPYLVVETKIIDDEEILRNLLINKKKVDNKKHREHFVLILRNFSTYSVTPQYEPELSITNGKGNYHQLNRCFDLVTDKLNEFKIIYPPNNGFYYKSKEIENEKIEKLLNEGCYPVFILYKAKKKLKPLIYPTNKRGCENYVHEELIRNITDEYSPRDVIFESRDIGEKILKVIQYKYLSNDYKIKGDQKLSTLLFVSDDLLTPIQFNLMFLLSFFNYNYYKKTLKGYFLLWKKTFTSMK